MQAKLVVTGGKASRKEVKLKVPVVVGRSRGAGLTIAHPMVSRQHCEIFESGGLLRIRDLGSTNGTYVDGSRIEEAVLRPREQFTIGPLTFEVDYEYAGDATVAEEKHAAYAGAGLATEAIPEAHAADEEEAAAEAALPSEAVSAAVAAPEPESPVPAWDDLPLPSEADWDAVADVPQVGVASSASVPEAPAPLAPHELAAEAAPAAPPPGIAPPDGALPDFSAWSEAPAADTAQTAMAHLFASDSSSSPGDEPLADAPTTALAPGVLAAHVKAKKSWWPFGRDKGRKPPRTPAQGPAVPDSDSFGATPEEPQLPASNEAPAAAVPIPPPPPRAKPAAPGPRDESRSALDDFLDGLQ